jgi:hypothetical protein
MGACRVALAARAIDEIMHIPAAVRLRNIPSLQKTVTGLTRFNRIYRMEHQAFSILFILKILFILSKVRF